MSKTNTIFFRFDMITILICLIFFQPKSRPFTCGWLREWCIAWWHSGHEDYELDDYWDDTASELGVGTPVSGDTPLQSSVSRCTSLNVIKEPINSTQNRLQDTRSLVPKNRLVSSRSVSSDSVSKFYFFLYQLWLHPD